MKQQEKILTWLVLGSLCGIGEMDKVGSQSSSEAPTLGPLRQDRSDYAVATANPPKSLAQDNRAEFQLTHHVPQGWVGKQALFTVVIQKFKLMRLRITTHSSKIKAAEERAQGASAASLCVCP